MMTRFGLSQEVHIQVEEASKGHRLRYRQTQGLFLSWNHLMEFEAHDAEYHVDEVDFPDYDKDYYKSYLDPKYVSKNWKN